MSSPSVIDLRNGSVVPGPVELKLQEAMSFVSIDGLLYTNPLIHTRYRIQGEGLHHVSMKDHAGNQTQFSFTIQSTLPSLTFRTVGPQPRRLDKNDTRVSSPVEIDLTDEVARLWINEVESHPLPTNRIVSLTQDGTYTIRIQARNGLEYTYPALTILQTIIYQLIETGSNTDFTLMSNFIASSPVQLTFPSGVWIEETNIFPSAKNNSSSSSSSSSSTSRRMYQPASASTLNGSSSSSTSTNMTIIFDQDGSYSLTLVDEGGARRSIAFHVLQDISLQWTKQGTSFAWTPQMVFSDPSIQCMINEPSLDPFVIQYRLEGPSAPLVTPSLAKIISSNDAVWKQVERDQDRLITDVYRGDGQYTLYVKKALRSLVDRPIERSISFVWKRLVDVQIESAVPSEPSSIHPPLLPSFDLQSFSISYPFRIRPLESLESVLVNEVKTSTDVLSSMRFSNGTYVFDCETPSSSMFGKRRTRFTVHVKDILNVDLLLSNDQHPEPQVVPLLNPQTSEEFTPIRLDSSSTYWLRARERGCSWLVKDLLQDGSILAQSAFSYPNNNTFHTSNHTDAPFSAIRSALLSRSSPSGQFEIQVSSSFVPSLVWKVRLMVYVDPIVAQNVRTSNDRAT